MELNDLEEDLLDRLGFNLRVTPDEFEHYDTELTAHARGADKGVMPFEEIPFFECDQETEVPEESDTVPMSAPPSPPKNVLMPPRHILNVQKLASAQSLAMLPSPAWTSSKSPWTPPACADLQDRADDQESLQVSTTKDKPTEQKPAEITDNKRHRQFPWLSMPLFPWKAPSLKRAESAFNVAV